MVLFSSFKESTVSVHLVQDACVALMIGSAMFGVGHASSVFLGSGVFGLVFTLRSFFVFQSVFLVLGIVFSSKAKSHS